MTHPIRFALRRETDVTGISGTGTVAHGVRWPDGTVSIRWLGERPSIVHWGSMDDVIAIHGHDGATKVVWLDIAEMPQTDFVGAWAALRAYVEARAELAGAPAVQEDPQ